LKIISGAGHTSANVGDIQACLRAAQSKPYRSGIRGKASRNTLANANL
jgi:hypothetical protein